jgi:peroxiredoxin
MVNGDLTWLVSHNYPGREDELTKIDTTFPSDLPVPKDDGACSHLMGSNMPSVTLFDTSGQTVDVASLSGLTIVFCYPRTGAPGESITDDWNAIPGARGCTPQACSFRDQLTELRELGVKNVFGLSTQDTPYQAEAKARLHLPYELLSDAELVFAKALKLPTFEWQGRKLIKRLALAIEDAKIIHVWYPVFPPDSNANEVVKWLALKK